VVDLGFVPVPCTGPVIDRVTAIGCLVDCHSSLRRSSGENTNNAIQCQAKNVGRRKIFLARGASWLDARGAWRMAHGAWRMAHGAEARCIDARCPMRAAPGARLCPMETGCPR